MKGVSGIYGEIKCHSQHNSCTAELIKILTLMITVENLLFSWTILLMNFSMKVEYVLILLTKIVIKMPWNIFLNGIWRNSN